jgi:hypothetical protein
MIETQRVANEKMTKHIAVLHDPNGLVEDNPRIFKSG